MVLIGLNPLELVSGKNSKVVIVPGKKQQNHMPLAAFLRGLISD